jgi:hypothetical protein
MKHVTHLPNNPTALLCLCGNTPADDGFYPVDEQDREVDPTAAAWPDNTYACRQCGRVIDGETLAVVRQGSS